MVWMDTNLYELLMLAVVVLVSVTGVILLLSKDWRLGIGALATQYIGVFVLTSISWPVEMAVVKLIAGWMAAAVLGMALVSERNGWGEDEPYLSSSTLFRLLAAGLVLPVVLTISPTLEEWLPHAQSQQVYGGMILIAMGLLHLGFKGKPIRVVIGLLTALAGFEVYYATLEISALVAGLLAAINLGLALVGTYLLFSPIMEEMV
jgi:hypothetical protein